MQTNDELKETNVDINIKQNLTKILYPNYVRI